MRVAVKYLVFMSMLFLITGCGTKGERRIKLAAVSSNGLAQDKVATIQFAAAKKKSIAVICFENQTGKLSLSWLEQGIVEMIVADLSQSRQLNLFSSDKVLETLRTMGVDENQANDPVIGLKAAKALNAEAFICGRYYNKNDSLVIEMDLRDGKNGNLMSRRTVTGSGLENVFTMMDNITRNLKNDLQVQLRESREVDQRIADIMTSSVDAYKQFSEGVESENRFYPREAAEHFQKAIELDSTFASAYLRLARIQFGQGSMDGAYKLLSKAVQYAEKASLKERLSIYALEAASRADLGKSIQLYKQITELFPEDDDAHFNLGTYYYNLGQIDPGIEEVEIATALNPKNKLAFNQLAYLYAHKGNMDLAQKALEKYIKLAADEPNPYDSMGEILQGAGRIDDAIRFYQKALKLNEKFAPTIEHVTTAYLDKGDYKAAQNQGKKLLKMAESEREKNNALYLLAMIEIAREDFAEAKEYLVEALEQDPFDAQAILLYEMIEPDSAENAARLQNWVSYLQNNEYTNPAQFNNLFDLVSYCLFCNNDLIAVKNILAKYMELAPSLDVKQASLALRQVLEMQMGEWNLETVKELANCGGEDAFLRLQRIPWESYWRYFFRGIRNTDHETGLAADYLAEMQKFAKRMNNFHFELNSILASAYLHQLTGEQGPADSLLAFAGVPGEQAWHVSGPYKITRGFSQQFYPEMNDMAKILTEMPEDLGWMASSDDIADGYVDLKMTIDAQFNNAVYAMLPIYTPKAKLVQMRFGTNKALKVWLNNEQIFIKNVQRKHAILDDYIFSAKLRSGINWMLVRLSGITGEYGIYFRLTDEKGYGFPDVQFVERSII
jgi:tetratricopeptide (TPR) repeat protein